MRPRRSLIGECPVPRCGAPLYLRIGKRGKFPWPKVSVAIYHGGGCPPIFHGSVAKPRGAWRLGVANDILEPVASPSTAFRLLRERITALLPERCQEHHDEHMDAITGIGGRLVGWSHKPFGLVGNALI